jgi:uncharacterized protein (DUF433 family)
VPAQSLIDHLKAGDSLEDFLEGFPSVSREQTEAFLELAFRSAVIEVDHARNESLCGHKTVDSPN